MKGSIQPGHIPVNKYQLIMVGLPELTPTEISGIEEELQTVDLPDRTKATGGNTGASEFTMMIPAHHSVECAAMESWFSASQDPVLPNYKKNGALVMSSVSLFGANRTFELIGCFPTKRKKPDLEMKNDGEMAQFEWTISVDQILPSG